MNIKKIHIQNFRNYDELSLDFNSNLNIFIGENAQGKTNLLESIYVLAITKSHRMFIDNNLIKKDKIFTKIEGEIVSEDGKKSLEVLINVKGKGVKINNNVIKKISEYISNFTVIIFYPDDLEIIKGSPSIRRKFLNIEIGQLNNKYLNILNEYNIILKNRNEYLKKTTIEKVDNNYIEIINEQLTKKSIDIYKFRYNFLSEINSKASNIYKELSENNILLIKYKPSIEFEVFDDNEIYIKMLEKLKTNLKRDIIYGNTMYGPHRDDFEFYIDNNEIKEYGSQGQHRLVVLSLKFGEIELFKEKKGEYPILLLDDIFSELDEKKKNNIVKYIKKDIQTFITTTDLVNINSKLLKNAKIYKIVNGKVKLGNLL